MGKNQRKKKATTFSVGGFNERIDCRRREGPWSDDVIVDRRDNELRGPARRVETTWSTCLIDELLRDDADEAVALTMAAAASDANLRHVRREHAEESDSLDLSWSLVFLKNALEYAIDRGMPRLVAALRARGVRTCSGYVPGMEVRDAAVYDAAASDNVSMYDVYRAVFTGARPRTDALASDMSAPRRRCTDEQFRALSSSGRRLLQDAMPN